MWKYPIIPSGRSYLNGTPLPSGRSYIIGTPPLTTQRLRYICDDNEQSQVHDACEHALYRNT